MMTTSEALHTEDVHAAEVARGERFEFGRNWSRFLTVLDEERIAAAERALQSMLRMERLDGRRFLDIGSGSGLSSLAARRLGARVHSFDFDPQSVACTAELRRRGWTEHAGFRTDACCRRRDHDRFDYGRGQQPGSPRQRRCAGSSTASNAP